VLFYWAALPLSRQTLPFVSGIIRRHRKAIDSRHVRMSATGRMDRNWGTAQSARNDVRLSECCRYRHRGSRAPGGVTVGADFTGGCPLRLVAAGGVLK
jgi:hypothetical protein